MIPEYWCLLDDWNNLTMYENCSSVNKSKAELHLQFDQGEFKERVELSQSTIHVRPRRPELSRVQSDAIFRFEVSLQSGLKKECVFQAPSKDLRDEWIRQIKWRLDAQRRVLSDETVPVVAGATFQIEKFVQSRKEKIIRLRLFFQFLKAFVRVKKFFLKKQLQLDSNKELVTVKSSRSSIQAATSPKHTRTGTGQLGSVGGVGGAGGAGGASSSSSGGAATAGSLEGTEPNSPALFQKLLKCCKPNCLNTKTLQQLKTKASRDPSSWIEAVVQAFNPMAAKFPAKTAPKQLSENEFKVYVLRLALFWVFLVSGFITCRFLLTDSFTKSIACIVITVLSMLVSLGFAVRSTVFRRNFADKSNPVDLQASQSKTKGRVAQGDQAEEGMAAERGPESLLGSESSEALLNKNARDPDEMNDQGQAQLPSLSLTHPVFLQYKWACNFLVVTGNAFAVFTIVVDGCEKLGGIQFRKHFFFAVTLLDFAILLVARVTEWLIVRATIVDDMDNIARYLNKQRHLAFSRFASDPNAFYCWSIFIIWCNITAVGFAPELEWDRTYAFGWLWEYIGIGA
jgi:hypothetical protein